MTDLSPYPGNTHWPEDWQGSRLRGRFIDILGQPVQGFLTFTPTPKAVLDAAHEVVILPSVRKVTLDEAGAFDVILPATDDPDLNPSGWTYKVTESLPGGRTYSIDAPMNADRDLTLVAPVPSSAGDAIVRGEPGADGKDGVDGIDGTNGIDGIDGKDGVVPATLSLASATGSITEVTIVDDGSATGSWPNRWVWMFKPLGLAAQLVQWVNEYGELRLIPAKVNTVALRIFAKQTLADPDHSGPVLEVQDSRVGRNSVWSVDGKGNMTSVGTVTATNIGAKVVVVDKGAQPPAGTPAGSLIVERQA